MISFIISTLILLITTPIYINYLGINQFGLYALIGAIIMPLNILGAGIGTATTKYIAEYESKGENMRCINIVATNLFINLIIGIIGVLFAFLTANWLATSIFNIETMLQGEAVYAFIITGFNWLVIQISGTFRAVVQGLQDFRNISIGTIIERIVIAIGGIISLMIYQRLSVLLFITAIFNFGFIFYWFYLSRSYFHSLTMIPRLDQFSIKKTLNFSLWGILNNIFHIFSNHIDKLLLGAYLSTSILGIYNVASRAQIAARGASSAMISTIFPASSAVSHREGESERLVVRSGWKISFIAGWFFACVYVLGPDFLIFWVGDEIGLSAGPVLQIFTIGLLLQVPSSIIGNYIYSQALPKWATTINIFTATIVIILSFIMIKSHGMIGVASAGVLGIIITRVPFHYWVFKKRFQKYFSIYEYLHSFYGILFSICLGGCGAYFVHTMLFRNFGGLLGFLLSIILSSISALLVIVGSESFLFRNKRNVISLGSSVNKEIKLLVNKFRQK